MSLLLPDEQRVLKRICRKYRDKGGSNYVASLHHTSRKTISKVMNGGSVEKNFARQVRGFIAKEVAKDPSLLSDQRIAFDKALSKFLSYFGYDTLDARSIIDYAEYIAKRNH